MSGLVCSGCGQGKAMYCPQCVNKVGGTNTALRLFMEAVASELGCLPSYADPSPDGDNAHIMRKLRELTAEPKG